jgi:ankyrin repeat protein
VVIDAARCRRVFGAQAAMSSVPLTAAQMAALGRELVAASRKGDVAEVRRLAAAGADVNVGEGTADRMPLATAAYAGHVEVVRELVARGARVDGADSGGWTSLKWAAYRGHAHVVDALVALGSRVDGAGSDRRTPLMWAAYSGHGHVVDVLVALGSQVEAVDALGNTALHFASKACQMHAVRSLVGAGARLDVRNSAGKTAADEVSDRSGWVTGRQATGRVRGWRACMHVWRRACCDGRLVGGWCAMRAVCAGVRGERRRHGWGGGDPCAGAAAADGGAGVGAWQAAVGRVPQG